MQWKDLFYFSRKERIGLLVLVLLILIALFLLQYLPSLRISHRDPYLSQFQNEYETFVSTKNLEIDSIREAKVHLTLTKKFNPNKDSKEELINAGLSQAIAQNIINYRNKGGVYRKTTDLKKLFTINDTIYPQIEAFIVIADQQSQSYLKPQYNKTTHTPSKQIEKLQTGTIIALNSADTTLLKKIPGIGSYYAKQIVRYRDKLGGFYTIKQFKEIDLDVELFKTWFSIDPTKIIPLEINKLDFKSLLKHPYLNYEQVKAIFNLRRKQGEIKSIKQLQILEEFDAITIDHLRNYLSFN